MKGGGALMSTSPPRGAVNQDGRCLVLCIHALAFQKLLRKNKRKSLNVGQKLWKRRGVTPSGGCLQADAGDWPFKTDKDSFVWAERIDGCALHFTSVSGRCCWRNQGLSWTCVRVKAASTCQEDTRNCALPVRQWHGEAYLSRTINPVTRRFSRWI